MARTSKLPISKTPSGKWRYDLPDNLSPTGKRQRKTFKTKELAELSREADLKRHQLYGIEGHAVTASIAADAMKATAKLSSYNTTLYAVACDWVEWQREREASCTLNELFDEFRAEQAKTVSDVYLKDYDKFTLPLRDQLGGEIVAHLQPKKIRSVMTRKFTTARQFANAFRTIRPAFTFAVREEYASRNPFDSIKIPKVTKAATEALALPEIKAVLNACCDYSESKTMPKSYRMDCTNALPAFCVMIFAGVRPEEITKLQWSSIHLDDEIIIIDGAIAKTRSHRIIPISDNLSDWLKLVPASERDGSLTPPNWRIRYAAVRHASKIKERQQDILRHTFASYHLAAHGDFSELQSAMGHATSEMILKHYKAIIRKPDAIKFWSIRPTSTKIQIAI